MVAAVAVALVLLFLTGPIADLPKAVLGAVIVVACIGLVDTAAWRALWATDRVELAIAAVTAAGVVVAGVLDAILFAVGLSIVDVVRRSARPHDAVLGWDERLGRWADVSVHRGARVTPGVVVYRLDDRLFFANAGYVKGRVREALRAAPTEPYALVLDAEGVSHVDAAGLDALAELASKLAGRVLHRGHEVARARARDRRRRGVPLPSDRAGGRECRARSERRDVAELVTAVEVRLERAVEAEVPEPVAVGDRLDPVGSLSGGRVGPKCRSTEPSALGPARGRVSHDPRAAARCRSGSGSRRRRRSPTRTASRAGRPGCATCTRWRRPATAVRVGVDAEIRLSFPGRLALHRLREADRLVEPGRALEQLVVDVPRWAE